MALIRVSSNVVATVGSAGQARPELTNFAQHFEQNTLCCPARTALQQWWSQGCTCSYTNGGLYINRFRSPPRASRPSNMFNYRAIIAAQQAWDMMPGFQSVVLRGHATEIGWPFGWILSRWHLVFLIIRSVHSGQWWTTFWWEICAGGTMYFAGKNCESLSAPWLDMAPYLNIHNFVEPLAIGWLNWI